MSDSQRSQKKSNPRSEVSQNSTDEEKLQRSGRDTKKATKHADVLRDSTNTMKSSKQQLTSLGQQLAVPFSHVSCVSSVNHKDGGIEAGCPSGSNEDENTADCRLDVVPVTSPQSPPKYRSRELSQERSPASRIDDQSPGKAEGTCRNHQKKTSHSTKERTLGRKTAGDNRNGAANHPERQKLSASESPNSKRARRENLLKDADAESGEAPKQKGSFEKEKSCWAISRDEQVVNLCKSTKKQEICQQGIYAGDKKPTGMDRHETNADTVSQVDTKKKKLEQSHDRQRKMCPVETSTECSHQQISKHFNQRDIPSVMMHDNNPSNNFESYRKHQDTSFDKRHRSRTSSNCESREDDDNSVNYRFEIETNIQVKDQRNEQHEGCGGHGKKVNNVQLDPSNQKEHNYGTDIPSREKVQRVETEPILSKKDHAKQLSEAASRKKMYQPTCKNTKYQTNKFSEDQTSNDDDRGKTANQTKASSEESSAKGETEDDDASDYRFDLDTPRETPRNPLPVTSSGKKAHRKEQGMPAYTRGSGTMDKSKTLLSQSEKEGFDDAQSRTTKRQNHKRATDMQETAKSMPATADQRKQGGDNHLPPSKNPLPPSKNLRKRQPKSYKEYDESLENLETEDNQARPQQKQGLSRSMISGGKYMFTKEEQKMSDHQKEFVHKTFTMSISSTQERTHAKGFNADPYVFEEEHTSHRSYRTAGASSNQAHSREKSPTPRNQGKRMMPGNGTFSWNDNDADYIEGSQEKEMSNEIEQHHSVSWRRSSLLPIKFITPDHTFQTSDDSQDQASPCRLFYSQVIEMAVPLCVLFV